ncbi:hypothetical protein [Alteriqipengyuania lutimaris]|nr:hypothetical protein [Alteriqipengyuania lutimaris]
MAAQMGQSLDQIERETSAVIGRAVRRWALRWAITFAIIFALTRMVDWLDWLWWIAVPIAAISLLVPLLFRRFLMKRLARVRGQMGGFGDGVGATIDGSWREASRNTEPDRAAQPDGIIIDRRIDDPPPASDDDERL